MKLVLYVCVRVKAGEERKPTLFVSDVMTCLAILYENLESRIQMLTLLFVIWSQEDLNKCWTPSPMWILFSPDLCS